jgi:hypothetical protein
VRVVTADIRRAAGVARQKTVFCPGSQKRRDTCTPLSIARTDALTDARTRTHARAQRAQYLAQSTGGQVADCAGLATMTTLAASIARLWKYAINDPNATAYIELPSTSNTGTLDIKLKERYSRQFDPLAPRPPTRQRRVGWNREVVLEIRRLSMTVWTLVNRVLLSIGVWFACSGVVTIGALAQLDLLNDPVQMSNLLTAVVSLVFGLWVITTHIFGKPWVSRSAVSNGGMSWQLPSLSASFLPSFFYPFQKSRCGLTYLRDSAVSDKLARFA